MQMESFPGAACLIVDLLGNDCQSAVKYASMTNCVGTLTKKIIVTTELSNEHVGIRRRGWTHIV